MKFLKLAVMSVLTVGLGDACWAGGNITGKAAFEGAAPKRKKLPVSADPTCAEMHADTPLLTEEVVVNENGTLRNVFVYVKTGLEGKTFEKPAEPVEIDQKGCQYFPHVMGMQAKQMLKIKNSDATTHNIHAIPENGPEFNKGQAEGGADLKTTFGTAEVMIPVKCDVHPWMSAYIGVLDHPFHSTTGAEGTYAIKDLPAGDYEIAAWHEKYGTQTQKVTVGEGETKDISFTFKGE